MQSKLRDFFEDAGMLNGIPDRLTPSEGRMICHQHAGTFKWIAFLERLHNRVAYGALVMIPHFHFS